MQISHIFVKSACGPESNLVGGRQVEDTQYEWPARIRVAFVDRAARHDRVEDPCVGKSVLTRFVRRERGTCPTGLYWQLAQGREHTIDRPVELVAFLGRLAVGLNI